MSRTTITPTTQVINDYTDATFCAVGTTAGAGWACDVEDPDRYVLIAKSSHTSAVVFTIPVGTSGTDWLYSGSTFEISCSIGTSAVGIIPLETVMCRSTSGIFVNCTSTGSTALAFACAVVK